MNFSFLFKFFPWLMIAPYLLYFMGLIFGLSTKWAEGRKERFIVSIAFIFVATFILAVLIWPSSLEEMAELIKANYFFPEDTNGQIP